MTENREVGERSIHEVTNNSIKLDPVRNISNAGHLRTMAANQHTRFMMATPVQSSSALISTTTTIQTQVLPKGAAAVANIAVPRSSVATPMVRGPATTLQTIGVTPAAPHPITGVGNVGRSVGGLTPWVTTCLTQQATPRQTPPSGQHQLRAPPPSAQQIQVSGASSRLVGGQMRPVVGGSDSTQHHARPLLLHTTTHKQITLTQQNQLQSFVDGVQQSTNDKSVTLKSYSATGCSQGNRTAASAATSGLSRLASALPQAVVSLQPAAVILPTTQSFPVKGTTTTQAKVLSQQSHGNTTMQISTVQPTIAINTVVPRPVMLASQATSASVPAVPPSSATHSMRTITGPQQHVKVYSNNQTSTSSTNNVNNTSVNSSNTGPVSISGAEAVSVNPSTPLYIHAPQQHKTVTNQQTTPGAVLVRPPHHTVKEQPDHQGLLSGNQGMRINSVMLVDSSRVQVHPFVAAPEGVTVVAESGITPTAVGTISIASTISHSLIPKQNTSPRPSILRKRDPPEGSPMKAQKNLTPVLVNMASSSNISSSCSASPPLNTCTVVTNPESPRLSESIGGGVDGRQSSSSSSGGGSTTLSANSSPGESPPTKLESQEEQDATSTVIAPPPSSAATILHQHQEMSPRKKPRKQQLTGSQFTEPIYRFSEDEMEFISEEKGKVENKVDEDEEKCLPKRTMSLLNGYRHPWKSRNNHFLRYSDIRLKEERKPTLSELANQKHALEKLNGWKIYHLNSQMEDMVNSETEFFGLYTSLLTSLEIKQKKCKNKDIDQEINRINERIRANFQRSKVVKDQMQEAKLQVMKLFEHKGYVADIINRNATKRPIKKRERL